MNAKPPAGIATGSLMRYGYGYGCTVAVVWTRHELTSLPPTLAGCEYLHPTLLNPIPTLPSPSPPGPTVEQKKTSPFLYNISAFYTISFTSNIFTSN